MALVGRAARSVRRLSGQSRAWVALVGALLSMTACFEAEGPRRYPQWKRRDSASTIVPGCVRIDGWVSKAGKEGMGVTLELRGLAPDEQPCLLEIASVAVLLGDSSAPSTHVATRLPPPALLTRGHVVQVYVPIRFDGDEAWNHEDKRHATIVVMTRPGGEVRWSVEQTLTPGFMCEEER